MSEIIEAAQQRQSLSITDRFDDLLDQLGISGEQKAEMLGLSDVKKEALLAQNASFLSYNNGSSSFSLKKHKSPGKRLRVLTISKRLAKSLTVSSGSSSTASVSVSIGSTSFITPSGSGFSSPSSASTSSSTTTTVSLRSKTTTPIPSPPSSLPTLPIDGRDSLEIYLEKMSKSKISLEELIHTRVQLTTVNPKWVVSFIENKGTDGIVRVLRDIDKKKKKTATDATKQLECARCFAALMNTKVGFDAATQTPSIFTQLVFLVDKSTPINTRSLSLQLLAAAALAPHCHTVIMSALAHFKETKREQTRFETLVGTLKDENDVDYLINCMAFINCLISEPASLWFRLSIRKDFINVGLLDAVKVLRVKYSHYDELLTQLGVFEDEMNADEQDQSSHCASTPRAKLLKRIAEEIFEVLLDNVRSTPNFSPFMTCLNSLLELCASETSGTSMWNVLNGLFNQLSDHLSANGSQTDDLEFKIKCSKRHSKSNRKTKIKLKEANFRAEMKKLRKDNDEKTETITHLLLQLNSIKGGQDYEMWMTERKEKNRIIAQLMQQISELERDPNNDKEPLYTQIQVLKCKVTKLKIEKDEIARQLADVLAQQQPANSDSEQSGLSDSGGASRPRERRNSMKSRPSSEDIPSSGSSASREERKHLGLQVEVPKNRRSRRLSTSGKVQRKGSTPPPPPPSPSEPPTSDKTTGSEIDPPIEQPSPTTAKRAIPPPPPTKSNRPYKTLTIRPSLKTKNLNWSTISPHKINNTIWERADDTSVVFDPTALEKLFETHRGQSRIVSSRRQTSSKISVVEFTRANNIGVMLAPFKGGISEVKTAIQDLNEIILTQEITANLLQCMPTKEELQVLSEYIGEPSRLGKAELYFKEISEIPRVEKRLQVHLFSLRYPELIDELRPDLKCVVQAATSARESKRLCRILEIVLAVGNFLNDNTSKGNAFGFRLESLKKLKDTRAGDGSTLLHFIAQLISSTYPDLWDWEAELCHLEHAAKVSWANVNEVMKTISSGVQLVAQEIVLANDPQDKYSGLLASLSALCAGEYDEVVREAAEAEKAMVDIAAFYGEPPAPTGLAPSPDVVFGTLVSFLDDLVVARKEWQRRNQLNSSLSSSSSSISSFRSRGERGGVDDVTATIRRGHIFKERRKTPLGSFSTSAPTIVVPPPSPLLSPRNLRSHSVVETMSNAPLGVSLSPSPTPPYLPRSWISKK